MQYQTNLNRQQLVELVLAGYFANIDRKDLDGTLACFHDCALVTVQTSFALHEGTASVRRMFADLFARHTRIAHKNIDCTVDTKNGRIAANYIEELVANDGVRTVFENTAFWRLRADRFQELYVYVSGAQSH